MAPGPNESPILSSSPLSIRVPSHSPVRHRTSSTHDADTDIEGLSRSIVPRHSPTLSRSHANPLDPDVRERQRAMDADMAIQLSRVRSATISQRSPVPPMNVRRRSDELTPTYNRYSLHAGPDFPFPEPERSVGGDQLDYGEPTSQDLGENQSRIDLLPSPVRLCHEEHDDTHIVPRGSNHHDLDMGSTGLEPVPSMGELPMYRPMSMQHTHPRWDFSTMEEFSKEEKIRLGIRTLPTPMNRARPSREAERDVADAEAAISTSTGFTLPPRRPRERKLSSSNAGNTRRGKMALFEQVINNSSGRPPLSTHVNIPNIPEGSLPPSSENIPAPTGGHDRPYRFSFYSNALSQTIHSRSLSELPAEGQTFEELFTGTLSPEPRSSVPPSGSTSPAINGNGNSKGIPTNFAVRMGLEDQVKKGNGDPDSETATWWLDVMSPTDEEMKMLSHVCSWCLGQTALQHVNASLGLRDPPSDN